MNRRYVRGAGLALTAAAVLMLPGVASATQVVPSPPPGEATLVTYYLNGAHTDDPVGQRIVGTCSAFVPWGTTTSYYTTSFITCTS
ncbi:MAG TPA: hypothetical protein VMB79_04865 [Jatrophihabitans sp.]|nr:hypothetical protein [Jatrophihabitans sp.]